MTVGFAALWRNNQREYAALPRDEWGTTALIQEAFARGRERGNRTYGLYLCRWSSRWQYLTFWVAPDMSAVFDTIADLERAGDFKFADSLHLVGRFDGDQTGVTPGAWDDVPEPTEGRPPPHAVLLREHAGGQSLRDSRIAGAVELLGVRRFGSFDCRFGSEWSRFSFWTAPSGEAVEAAVRTLDVGVDLRLSAVTGRLDRYFRFGNRLQTRLTWLNEEVEGE
jgi:hypothetical protein